MKSSTGPVIAQAALADGLHDSRVGVADQHVVTVPGQAGRHRAADGTAAEHEVAHGVDVTRL